MSGGFSSLWRRGASLNGPRLGLAFCVIVLLSFASLTFRSSFTNAGFGLERPVDPSTVQNGDQKNPNHPAGAHGTASGYLSPTVSGVASPSASPHFAVDDDEPLPLWAQTPTRWSGVGCPNNTLASSVLLILNTGSTDLYSKLPLHLLTTLRCAPNYFIFSDFEQRVASHHIMDALADISPKWKDEHKDFEKYRQQQEMVKEGVDVGTLTGGKGWELNKWKFLPMFKKSWNERPSGTEWFVYLEIDTYFSWHNLLLWLSKLDAGKNIYMGSQVLIGDTELGRGASGLILSQAAMRRFSEEVDAAKEDWEEKTSQECCGDKVVADMLMKRDVKLMKAFPLIQGETAWSADWTESRWCKAAISWQHTKPREIDAYWRFDREWASKRSDPILFRDYYMEFVHPNLKENRTNWDNLSGDWKFTATSEDGGDSYQSFEACQAECISHNDCLQFMWEPGTCSMGKAIRMGDLVDAKDDKRDLKSGWLLKRIDEFVAKQKKCQPEDAWILHRP